MRSMRRRRRHTTVRALKVPAPLFVFDGDEIRLALELGMEKR